MALQIKSAGRPTLQNVLTGPVREAVRDPSTPHLALPARGERRFLPLSLSKGEGLPADLSAGLSVVALAKMEASAKEEASAQACQGEGWHGYTLSLI